MNYAIVAIGAVILLVGACWAFWGRLRFTGPVKTVMEEGPMEFEKGENVGAGM